MMLPPSPPTHHNQQPCNFQMDSCDPEDFLTVLVVTLAGAATSLYLSSVDFGKQATVTACCEVRATV